MRTRANTRRWRFRLAAVALGFLAGLVAIIVVFHFTPVAGTWNSPLYLARYGLLGGRRLSVLHGVRVRCP
jgi:hypothetical protein